MCDIHFLLYILKFLAILVCFILNVLLHIFVMKGKVHPCTGTEALYRPYGP